MVKYIKMPPEDMPKIFKGWIQKRCDLHTINRRSNTAEQANIKNGESVAILAEILRVEGSQDIEVAQTTTTKNVRVYQRCEVEIKVFEQD